MKAIYYLSLLVFSLSVIGCATTPQKNNHPEVFFGEKPDFESMRSFQKLVQATPGTEDFEKARIDYLIERLSKSPYTFVRNDEPHSNTRAVVHVKWKYFRFRKDSPTAEAFVKYVASGSRRSGRPYLLKINKTDYVLLRKVWENELKLLDQGFLEHQERVKKQFEASKEAREELAGSEAVVESFVIEVSETTESDKPEATEVESSSVIESEALEGPKEETVEADKTS